MADPPPRVESPPVAEWEAFWAVADGVGVWNWMGDYGRGVVCGIPWRLAVVYRGRAIQCSGNGFAGEFAPPEFDRLYRALCRLIKRKSGFGDEDSRLPDDPEPAPPG
jgi:hypothetical protein